MEKRFVLSIVAGMFLAMALIAGAANADITTGLAGYWPFEEGQGVWTEDASGNGHDGTLMGTPTWDSGPEGFGNALLFDAGSSGDGVECGTACNPGSVFTLAIWAYCQGTDVYQSFMIKSDDWDTTQMMWQWELWGNSGIAGFADKVGISSKSSNGIVLSTDVMPENEWVHLAITYDGSVAQLFINGVADPLGPQNFIVDSGTNAMFSIGVGNGGRRSFDGYLDEACVYSRVLSLSDIQQLAGFDPDFNFPPCVYAGDYQSLLWQDPSITVQLDATVTDDGKPADPCEIILTWSQLSGTGTVQFSDTTIEDPTATFSAIGFYELQLSASDGEKDACDVVKIHVDMKKG